MLEASSLSVDVPSLDIELDQEERDNRRSLVRSAAWQLQMKRLASSSLDCRHGCQRMVLVMRKRAAWRGSRMAAKLNRLFLGETSDRLSAWQRLSDRVPGLADSSI